MTTFLRGTLETATTSQGGAMAPTEPARQGESATRWAFYTVEPVNGSRGPFGPVEAEGQMQAETRARARLAGVAAVLTLDRVEPWDET